jgi:hypothetical protein
MRVEGCVRVAIDANQLGRHPLPHLGLMVWFCQHDETRVRVHVDEAGTDDVAFGIDNTRGFNAREVTPQDPHAFPFNPHGPIKARITSAIDDHAIANEQIEHGKPPKYEC